MEYKEATITGWKASKALRSQAISGGSTTTLTECFCAYSSPDHRQIRQQGAENTGIVLICFVETRII